MIKLKKKYLTNILLFFAPALAVLIISSKFNGINIILIIMLLIILMLTINLAYKNKKYKKLYNLAESNKRRYRMAIEALDGAIWEWSSENNKLFISKKIKGILKINRDINNFDEWISYILEEEREDIRVFIENIINKRILDNFILEHSVIDTKGNRLFLSFQGKGNVKDNIFYLSGFITDNTEKRMIENINKANENNTKLALQGSKDIVFWWNINENIMSIGSDIKKYLNLSGTGDILIPTSTWESYIVNEDLKEYKKNINNIIKSDKNEFYTLEYRILGKNNKEFWVESKGKKTVEKNGSIFIHGAISEITNRKKRELEINYLSFYDEVIGIPNRRYFMKEASRLIRESSNKKIAFIFIDLDNFKYVNDTYGHDSGDALLCEFSRIILDMQIENSFLSRYGGDEFVIVKSNIEGNNEIKVILDNIIKKLSNPLIINNREIYCTLSIGVSIYPFDGKELGVLLKRSDMAMYLAKINGKNRYEFFDLKLLEVLDREFEIEKGLRIAIDNEEIKLVYQPKININTGKVIGFESLVRWHSKTLGIVSPKEFIPIAESSGLIITIGKYIIDDSFKKCKELSLKTDKKFKMAINLSEVQIRDDEIVEYMAKSLKKYKLDASYIELEITESIIMKSAEKNIKTLEKLKKLGVTLALDDFGTGYSSLSYLRTLPIDVLKIDKSFIDGILIEEKSEYIINSIIDLSHYLNLLVVAEGVETNEQLEYLKKSKCDIIQGYYFSKPVEFEEICNMIIG
ncbi:GGDEF and EAL domain-containing protein [Clostridium sp. AL.422]|uniref:sensor domain-containing protein n=1 Tax=Clostridium TaxID=1485 RepID=UPI00293DE25E|nr:MULTISPECIES: GGDEF and EAL domain-containing protein [unclassified Clostridium]MDV4149767.1 GGDEF and EAL domain-containing protein [Clostridium sp. AL.422]